MNIKRRIWALPATAICVFCLGLALSSYMSIRALATVDATRTIDYPVLSQSTILETELQNLIGELKSAILESDSKRLEILEDKAQRIRANLKRFAAIPGNAQLAARLDAQFDAYFAPAMAAAKILLGVEQGDAQPHIEKMQAAMTRLVAETEGVRSAAQRQFDAGIDASAGGIRRVLIVSAAMAVVVVLTLCGVSHLVVRGIWQQLGGEPGYARSIAQAVAGGDLAVHIVTDGANQGSLLGALGEMKGRLAAAVRDIRGAADEIKLASSEIASGTGELSARTEQQAGNLGAAAMSLQGLSATLQSNAQDARQANTLASDAVGVAKRGAQVVSDVVRTMAEIDAFSKRIADITSVIDGIAFQTNILALNAAVEAARAGDQGRGFAVVATEVRNLAQRSAGAAKEIKQLIGDSLNSVVAGASLVGEAGRTMDDIVVSVQRVNNIICDIADASGGQSDALSSLNASFGAMDTVTQQNAAMSEQAAAAADALQDLAAQLHQAIGVFKLAQLDVDDAGAETVPVSRHHAPHAAALTLAAPHEGAEARPAAHHLT
ncbi:MAG: methyl-accepting chemotaxis protein [Pseudomonadota bacterium]